MATAEASPPPTLRDHRWRWRDLVIGLAPVLLVNVLTNIYRGGIRNSLPEWSWIAFGILSMAWILAWPLWAARQRPTLSTPRRILVEACWAILAIPVLMVAQMGLLLVLPRLLGPQEVVSPFDSTMTAGGYHRVALAILAVGVAPFAEEVFFRGMVYNALRQRSHFLLAALISGAAFGLLHPFGRSEQISIMMVGFVLALLYEWRKTLVAPILLHGMINALSMVVLLYTTTNTPALGVRSDPDGKVCVLIEVVPGSSAAEGGLKVGDVIKAAGENSVGNAKDLTRIVRSKRIGDKLPVWYSRDGEDGYVEVILKGRPTP